MRLPSFGAKRLRGVEHPGGQPLCLGAAPHGVEGRPSTFHRGLIRRSSRGCAECAARPATPWPTNGGLPALPEMRRSRSLGTEMNPCPAVRRQTPAYYLLVTMPNNCGQLAKAGAHPQIRSEYCMACSLDLAGVK